MGKLVAKIFRASDSGLGKVLGTLEEEIMNTLWELKSAKGSIIFNELLKRKKIALTTVLTVLERLVKKGLVSKTKVQGNFHFAPVHTRDDFSAIVSREVLRGLLDMSSGNASANFVEILAETRPEELKELEELIEAKRRELKK
ncbi:MAG: BlaI/MecI/CopY family transcriptional regulator [Deltaproteobacteria bacterium]|nr:BlaI/MecI/CopY family transcriptional regulator [Deltaproteobacteria bacterium]